MARDWTDLFIVDGHVYPFVEKYNLGEEFRQPRQLFWNRGDGQFFDMSSTGGPGIAAKHASRGIAVADLDNDGDVDLMAAGLDAHGILLLVAAPWAPCPASQVSAPWGRGWRRAEELSALNVRQSRCRSCEGAMRSWLP